MSAEAPAAQSTIQPPGLHRRLAAVYLFCVYLMAAASETFISPFFPIVRHDLGLDVSNQATLIAVLTSGIGLGNLIGGAAGYHVGDRLVVRRGVVHVDRRARLRDLPVVLAAAARSGDLRPRHRRVLRARPGQCRAHVRRHPRGGLAPPMASATRWAPQPRRSPPASRASTGGCPST